MPVEQTTSSRQEAEDRFLDAAERLLIEVGHAGVTTRRLAEEAAANHGLVHYYFGSMEELFVQVLERFTSRLVARQREMYASDIPYVEKWREAMHYLDRDQPYQKIWWELQAMAWNRPQFRDRITAVHASWCEAMRDAVAEAHDRYGLSTGPLSADDWVTLIVALNEGLILERLSGVRRGHEQLLSRIDAWLAELENQAGTAGAERARPGDPG